MSICNVILTSNGYDICQVKCCIHSYLVVYCHDFSVLFTYLLNVNFYLKVSLEVQNTTFFNNFEGTTILKLLSTSHIKLKNQNYD